MEVLNKKPNGQAELVPAIPPEKRSCPRYPFSPEVEVVDIQSETRLRARLSDISRNGCYVDTINPFPKDSPIRLSITRDNISFKTQGKVAYSVIGMGMGVLFTTSEPDQLQSLGKWLTELSGGKSVAPEPSVATVQPESTKNVDPELRKIFGDLVAVLNGKNILNDSEAMALLRKLSK
jgi:PilZ domain